MKTSVRRRHKNVGGARAPSSRIEYQGSCQGEGEGGGESACLGGGCTRRGAATTTAPATAPAAPRRLLAAPAARLLAER